MHVSAPLRRFLQVCKRVFVFLVFFLFKASLAIWPWVSLVLTATALMAYSASASTIPIAGHYEQSGKGFSATLDIAVIGAGRISVKGEALWGTDSPNGPHTGDLEFQARVVNDQATYEEKSSDETYRLTLKFLPKGLTAEEQGSCEDCGMNVQFSGNYRRVGSTMGKSAQVEKTDSQLTTADLQVSTGQHAAVQVAAPSSISTPLGGVLQIPKRSPSVSNVKRRRQSAHLTIDEALSQSVSESLHAKRLPFVNAQVFVDPAGEPIKLVLSGRVRTEFGRQDAEHKAADSVGIEQIKIDNQIQVGEINEALSLAESQRKLDINPLFQGCWIGSTSPPEWYQYRGDVDAQILRARQRSICALRKWTLIRGTISLIKPRIQSGRGSRLAPDSFRVTLTKSTTWNSRQISVT